MNLNNTQIFLAYKASLKKYLLNHKSKHWNLNYTKKKNLLSSNYLDNFRNNNFSDGLDVKSYGKDYQKKLFNKLIDSCGTEFVYKNLLKENIGNLQSYGKFKDKFFDNNQFYSIKWLHTILKITKKNKINYICEIGGGYGCFAEKLIKKFNCKYIMIDLPEANILSSFYLSKHFPNKKIFIYNENITQLNKKDFNKYDIFVIPPWVKLDKIKIDLFINTRSFMEMNFDIVKSYFNLIQANMKLYGFFFNNNRYYKDTVGHPIKFCDYPYDKKWNVAYSSESWNETHLHTLITRRNDSFGNISKELKLLKKITQIKKNQIDKFFIKKLLPNFVFNLLVKLKNKIL